MSTDFDPPIKITLGNNPGVVKFKNSQEVINWLQTEYGFWQNLWNQTPQDQWAASIWNGQEAPFFQNYLNDFTVWHNESRPRPHWESELSGGRLSPYSSGQRIHSQSARGRFVAELRNPSLVFRVAYLLCVPRNAALPMPGPGVMYELWSRAAFIAGCFERSWIDDVAPSVDQAFANVLGKWEKQFGEYAAAQETVRKDLQAHGEQQQALNAITAETNDRHRELLGKQTSEVSAALEQSRSDIENHLNASRAEIDAYKAQVKGEIAFKAPITYWLTKGTEHKRVRQKLFYSFLAVLIVGTITLLIGAGYGLRYILANHLDFKYEMVLPFALAAFPLIWVSRILSRRMLTNIALEEDAGERVAMAQTFLALMEDGDKVKEADRILILASLFRPSAKGDGDDATPPNWFDALMQRIGPKKD